MGMHRQGQLFRCVRGLAKDDPIFFGKDTLHPADCMNQ
jgi:hypothetical protein